MHKIPMFKGIALSKVSFHPFTTHLNVDGGFVDIF